MSISAKYICSKVLSNLDVIADNYEIKWIIENFNKCKSTEAITSPLCSIKIVLHNCPKKKCVGEVEWELQLCYYDQLKQYRLLLNRIHCNNDLIPKIYVSLESLAINGNLLETNAFETIGFRGCSQEWQPFYAIDEKEFVRIIDQCNNLTIVCDLIISENIFDKNIDSEPINNLRTMFNEEKFSDASILVGGKKFLVHKIVLSMSSDVFAAMFGHDVLENNKNEVRIADFDCKTVEDLLKFIYYKEPAQISFDLLAIANKYNIKLLKKLCEHTLGHRVTEDNVIETLNAAHLHEANDLKQFAIAFLAYDSCILTTSFNKQLKKLNKDVIIELLIAISYHIENNCLVFK